MDSTKAFDFINSENSSPANKNYNEYTFRWGKKFSYLTLKTLDSKLNINYSNLNIEMKRYYLGFIKGKTINHKIPLGNITHIESKKLVNLSDLVIPLIYILGGFLNPFFYPIAVLSIWACVNTHIIITNSSGVVIKIPSYSKKDAEEFIDYFRDIYID